MDNKLYNTIEELGRSIRSAQEDARQCTSPDVNPRNVFQSELDYKMQQYVHHMHSYLNIDRVMGFPIQPINYSSETSVSDRGVSIRVAIHHYPPVKPMIIEAPEMILELHATVDLNGRMEYQFSNYLANPTNLKALANHLPEGSCLILLEDGSLSVEALDESTMESSWGFSGSNFSMKGDDLSLGDFSCDWINSTLDYSGKIVGSGNLINGGIKSVAKEYIRQVAVNSKLAGIQNAKLPKFYGTAKGFSRKLGVVGGVIVAGDILYNSEVKASDGINVIMTGIAFTGWGAPIAGVWFIADFSAELLTGVSLSEQIDSSIGKPLLDWDY
ncbi:hypothetical protein BZG01_16335 [Labilibaculum manganireducens]|uniref:Uncharacterized protein n=1 Tax=Labilibaculum manganireducens TaxID=1940525 RepID=A0A2N3HYZ0_9BACT|nr:hypothetical protein [Labilibaculum manganireducens]PKQ63288.1 hypothetical protein BZG01_16335 [Labilibaculum manganireducens]